MLSLTAVALERLTENAATLEADGLGPKVLRLEDGSILKLFRKRRFFSSETLKPYAQRFADNADQLRALGFISPSIVEVYRLPGPVNFTAVRYLPLQGETLRHSLKNASMEERQQLTERFGELLARLHQAGIYFRSAHLGNVLLLPDGHLGLIDLADMHISDSPLGSAKRRRNLRHLRRYREDAHWLLEENRQYLLRGYERHTSPLAASQLANWLTER